MACRRIVVRIPELRASGFSNSGDDISRYPEAAYDMVYGDVADYHAEERGECGRLEAGIEPEKLSNGMDMAAQNKAGHGSARTGAAVRGH
jgi:hypothetical protein